MKRRDFAIGLASGGLAALAVAPRAGRAENAPLKMVAPPPTPLPPSANPPPLRLLLLLLPLPLYTTHVLL